MCLTWQWGKAGLTDWRQSEGSKSNYIDRQLQKKWSNKTNLVMHSTPNNNRVLEAKENIWVATIRKVNWASFCLRSPHKICYTFMVIFFRYCAEYQLGSRNLTSCFKPAMCLPSLLRLCNAVQVTLCAILRKLCCNHKLFFLLGNVNLAIHKH